MQINASGLRTSIVSFMARSVWCLSPLLEWHMHWTWSDATYTFIAHIKSINLHALISNNQMRMSPNIYTGKWLFRTTAGCHFSSQFVRRRESSAVLNQNSNIYISQSPAMKYSIEHWSAATANVYSALWLFSTMRSTKQKKIHFIEAYPLHFQSFAHK